MIKIKKNIKNFIKIFEIAKNFNTEVTVIFSPKNIRLQAVAISNISFCNFIINKSMFDEYNITDTKSYNINIDIFTKLLKKVGKKEVILEMKDDGMHILNTKETYKLKYFIASENNRETPVFEYKTKWIVNTEEFFDKITEVKELSEIIGLEGNSKLSIKIKGLLVEGQSFMDAEAVLVGNEFCYYDTTYLMAIKDITTISEKINVNFSSETACYITAETADIKFEWMLAPRVDDGTESNENE